MANIFKRFAYVHHPLKFQIRELNVSSLVHQWKPSYQSLPSTEPLLSTTVGEIIESVAEKNGDKEALVICHQQIRKNYAQFNNDVNKLATGLIAVGLNKGDRIGVWSTNNYEWILVQFASARAGLVLVNVNPAFQAKEVEYCLNKVGVRALVMSETFKNHNYYNILNSVVMTLGDTKAGETNDSRVPKLTHVVMLSDKPYKGTLQFKEVFEAGGAREREKLLEVMKLVQFDDPVNIQYTSGTTGYPKGATLSHHNVVNNAHFYARRMGFYEKSHRMCVNVPLYHCFGCVMGTLATYMSANCTVFPYPIYNAKAAAEAIQQEKTNVIYGTPTMFVDILNLPDFKRYDFSSLETGLMAGAPCSAELLSTVMNALGAKRLTSAYGATELSPLVVMPPPTASMEVRANTSGSCFPHMEVKLVDDKGAVVGVGSPGEFMSRGYHVMLGYWNDEEKTREVLTTDRWYKTGDIATMDADGNFKITGRKKDTIIRGGENIYPTEIENFLHSHPKIAEVQVVGVPDSRMGEEVCAWIRLKSGENLTVDEVKDYCESKISHFKIPRYILFMDDFPKTITGKIQKYVMREESEKILNIKKRLS